MAKRSVASVLRYVVLLAILFSLVTLARSFFLNGQGWAGSLVSLIVAMLIVLDWDRYAIDPPESLRTVLTIALLTLSVCATAKGSGWVPIALSSSAGAVYFRVLV